MAGGVDDDGDLGGGDQRQRIVGDVRRPVCPGRGERARRIPLGGPAGARERRPGALGREVGDADDVDARRVLRLREVHRAELARADQSDGEGAAFAARWLQQPVQIHFVSSGKGDIGIGSWNACAGAGARSGEQSQVVQGVAHRLRRRQTRRATMPSRPAASTLSGLSSTNSTRSAGTSSASITWRKYAASGFSLPTWCDGKLWWKCASSDHSRRKRSQWNSLVFDTLASR